MIEKPDVKVEPESNEEKAFSAAGVLLLKLTRHMKRIFPSGKLTMFQHDNSFIEFNWVYESADKRYGWRYAVSISDSRFDNGFLFDESSSHWDRSIRGFARQFEAVPPFKAVSVGTSSRYPNRVQDVNGDIVLVCFDDDDPDLIAHCDRKYSQSKIEADPNFICPCGRIADRMSECSPHRAGLSPRHIVPE